MAPVLAEAPERSGVTATDPTDRPRRGWHVAIVVTLVAIGLVRALYWVVALEVTSPIDEVQHAAYVISVAEDGTPPVVGTDTVPREYLEIVERSRTWPVRQVPVEYRTDDPAWGAVVASYEGVQPPLYYLTLAPVYLAAETIGAGPLATLFVLRVATVLIALTAIPFVYLLARELFPAHPAVWLAAPGLLVLVQGFNGNLAQVTNDAMVVPLAVLALLPVARAIRRGPTWWQAIALGGLLGAAQLTKATTVGLIALAAVGALIAVAVHRPRARYLVGWPLLTGAVAAVVLSPWIAWNLATYDAISAASRVEGITGPLQQTIPMTLPGLVAQAQGAASAFWELQLAFLDLWHPYPMTWYVAAALAVTATLVLAARTRRWPGASVVLWLAVSLPVGFATMLLVIYVVTGGAGEGLGRHLYVAMGPTVLAIAAGIVLALPRPVSTVVIAVVAATSLWTEVAPTRSYLEVYSRGVEDGAVPVVDQTANDGWVDGATVVVEPPCPAVAVRLIVDDETPPETLTSGEGTGTQLRLTAADSHSVGWTSARYEPARPITGRTAVVVPPGTRVGSVSGDRTPALAFADRPGDPAVSILCDVQDPDAVRFEQVYDQLHPDVVGRDLLRTWPVVWAWAGTTGAAAVVGWAIWRYRSGRRRDLD